MVGDDGAANQIGVAPGAKWISANGCCPSDAALIASGEWMLAPTEPRGPEPRRHQASRHHQQLLGHERAEQRPVHGGRRGGLGRLRHLGQWSNGNNGPACDQRLPGQPDHQLLRRRLRRQQRDRRLLRAWHRPGRRDQAEHLRSRRQRPLQRARQHLRQPQRYVDGLAAPRRRDRAALVGGSVAARRHRRHPGLARRQRDRHRQHQCGGTADDNNVFGEGRLDALALRPGGPDRRHRHAVRAPSPRRRRARSAAPRSTSTATGERTLTTDDDGTYSLARSPTGDYTAVRVAVRLRHRRRRRSRSPPTRHDAGLRPGDGRRSRRLAAPSPTGRGHGWPLYAKVAIAGPAPDVWTDPTTGDYSVELPSGATYAITVTAQYPATCRHRRRRVDGATTHDVALTVDDSTCTAPRLRLQHRRHHRGLRRRHLPAGWTVTDNQGNGQVWRFDDPGNRGNLTGGTGKFAIMDSDFYGTRGQQDTSLVTPSIDMSALTAPVVGFKQDYNNLGDFADVDVSIDGGDTWTTVLHQTTDVQRPARGRAAAADGGRPVRGARSASTTTTRTSTGGGRSTTSSSATAPVTRSPAARRGHGARRRDRRTASTARP